MPASPHSTPPQKQYLGPQVCTATSRHSRTFRFQSQVSLPQELLPLPPLFYSKTGDPQKTTLLHKDLHSNSSDLLDHIHILLSHPISILASTRTLAANHSPKATGEHWTQSAGKQSADKCEPLSQPPFSLPPPPWQFLLQRIPASCACSWAPSILSAPRR